MYKRCLIPVIYLMMTLSIIGCGNENKSMYEVQKTPEVVENKPIIGYGEVEATIAEGADKDKNLGKKQLIMINGQPIAALIDEYTNESGYTVNAKEDITESIESDANETDIEPDKKPINSLTLLGLVKLNNESKSYDIEQICNEHDLVVMTLDMQELENLAETDNSIVIDNSYDVKEMIVASTVEKEQGIVTLTYAIFNNIEDELDSDTIKELELEDRELLTFKTEAGEYSQALATEAKTDLSEYYYIDIANNYMLTCICDDTGESIVLDILDKMGIK